MNPEPLLVADALLLGAEKRCRSRLVDAPDNPSLLESYGDVLRKLGKINEAAAAYQSLTQLKPDDQNARYRYALTAGLDPMPEPPPGMQPSPFVLLKNFLPESFHDTLVPFTLSVESQLTPATVGADQYNPNHRESLELRERNEIQSRFVRQIKDALWHICDRLHVTRFELGKLEAKLRVYLDGHFFRLHCDNPADSPLSCTRHVSYVYFYHRMPRGYTGGDLLLFDTDLQANRYTITGFTRITPVDNAVVFFPSGCYHSVVPVKCPSKQIADSRFVINGHVHRVETKEEAEASEAVRARIAAQNTPSPTSRGPAQAAATVPS
jgi:Rps23 Pro-64 3,4-dihydroxylase Tpa1-like proline 4-hydroxylase